LKRLLFVPAALALALAVSLPGAFARTDGAAAPKADPGISKSQIVIGGTFPLTGGASLYAPIPKGMDAYFKWVNQRKGPDGKVGIYGRKIVWKYYDDAYNPANTVQLTNQLVLQDKVFAIVGTLGTEPNIPIRPILNQRKVPQILVSTGASYWGLQYKQFPWTTGWQPDYIAEGIAYGRWIARNAPNAKIAVFFQNDDYGKDYLKGLKIGLAAKRTLIVSELGYEITDTSYGSQIARQKATGADTWVLLTTPTPTVRAIATAKALNWKPDFVRLMYLAGKNPTRNSLIRATAHMNWINPFTIKGIRIKTGPQDRFPISQMKLIRYNAGTWSEFGPLLKGR
jgi:branched-chain amino acid transport system substrate-binding protein